MILLYFSNQTKPFQTMKIRHSFAKLFFSAALVASIPTLAKAAPIGERKVVIEQDRFERLSPDDQQGVLDLQVRMETLLATDRAELSSQERAELRKDYKAMKTEMRSYNAAGGNVIYISTAGLIIIILLLIILL